MGHSKNWTKLHQESCRIIERLRDFLNKSLISNNEWQLWNCFFCLVSYPNCCVEKYHNQLTALFDNSLSGQKQGVGTIWLGMCSLMRKKCGNVYIYIICWTKRFGVLLWHTSLPQDLAKHGSRKNRVQTIPIMTGTPKAVPPRRCCRHTCQISEPHDHHNIQSRGFKTSQSLVQRPLTV